MEEINVMDFKALDYYDSELKNGISNSGKMISAAINALVEKITVVKGDSPVITADNDFIYADGVKILELQAIADKVSAESYDSIPDSVIDNLFSNQK